MENKKGANKLISVLAFILLVVMIAISTVLIVNNTMKIVKVANSKVELIEEDSKKENIEYNEEPVLVGMVATVDEQPEKTEEQKKQEEEKAKAKEEAEAKKAEEEKKAQEEEAKRKQEENKQTYSNTRYYLKVNYLANVITVYTKDANGNLNPCKAITCSTGTDTPRSGVYTTGNKWRWKLLFHDWWGQYATHITGDILFHSVPYYSANNDALSYALYDQLGTAASMGCIRLTVADAKWLYDNVPTGTPVEFYGSYTAGPLGKPETMRISSNTTCRSWDPTDPAAGNPWHTYFAEQQKKESEEKAEKEAKAKAEKEAAAKKEEEEKKAAEAKKKAEEEKAKAEEEARKKEKEKKEQEDKKNKVEKNTTNKTGNNIQTSGAKK